LRQLDIFVKRAQIATDTDLSSELLDFTDTVQSSGWPPCVFLPAYSRSAFFLAEETTLRGSHSTLYPFCSAMERGGMVLGPSNFLLPSDPTRRCVRHFRAEHDSNTMFLKRLVANALKCAMNGSVFAKSIVNNSGYRYRLFHSRTKSASLDSHMYVSRWLLCCHEPKCLQVSLHQVLSGPDQDDIFCQDFIHCSGR